MTGFSPAGHSDNHPDHFSKMIFLSFIIHLIVLTLLLASVRTSSRHLTFGPTYTVQLVGADAISSLRGNAAFQDIIGRTNASDFIIIKTKMNSIFSPAAKTPVGDKLNIQKAVNALRQKGQQDVPHAAAIASSRPVLSEAETNSQGHEYMESVWAKVKQNWSMPPNLLPSQNIIAVIDVKIARSGALLYANFEKRSGNRFFDESAMRAVKKSSPFPPLPYWVREDNLAIGIRFHSAELH